MSITTERKGALIKEHGRGKSRHQCRPGNDRGEEQFPPLKDARGVFEEEGENCF